MFITPQQPILKVEQLSFSYSKTLVLDNISFSLPAAQLIGIIGPNGSGKSTLLKIMLGLLPIQKGKVSFFDQSIEKVRQKIAYLPQRETIDWDFPISVRELVSMGRYSPKTIFRKTTAQDKQIVQESLEKVGLQDLANRHIAQLSGGQQQRAFLARALAQEADIYLFDEPFVGIDANTENALLKLIQTMKTEGKTIVIVHHDLQTVMNFFEWTLLLNKTLFASGPTKQVFTPELLNKTYNGQLMILDQLKP